MTSDPELYINLRGKQVVTYRGLLHLAHQRGLLSIETEMIQAPTADNDRTAIMRAVVTMEDKRQDGDLSTLRHFTGIGDANPRNVGKFDAEDPSIGTGMVGAPACGDVMRLQIKVNEQGVIEDAKFKTYGCGSAIASSSLATEWMKGKTLEEAETIKNTQLAEELALPPVKIHCSVLAEDAIKAAVRDYREKKGLL
jgi:nitrogen fixation NifU-like protein